MYSTREIAAHHLQRDFSKVWAEALMDSLLPAVAFERVNDPTSPHTLGGLPLLPSGTNWPMGGIPRPDQDDPRFDAATYALYRRSYLSSSELTPSKNAALAEEAKQWTLLLQLSAKELDVGFAEGEIYFLIKKIDLKAQQFERTITVYQQT